MSGAVWLGVIVFPVSAPAFWTSGLRGGRPSDLVFSSLDSLFSFLGARRVLEPSRFGAIRLALENGGEFETEISEADTRSLGFSPPGFN
jgi:hypothetical protein